MIKPFITEDELEDLLDYGRHEHPSDTVVRKLLKVIGQKIGFNEKRTINAFREKDPLVTELFWAAFDRMLDAQDMRERIGRVNRASYCSSCKAFHLWYDPLNSQESDPSAVSKMLMPALRTH